MRVFLVVMFLALSITGIANAGPAISPSYEDLWDIKQGTVVTGSSRILNHGGSYYSDARDMFGGSYGQVEKSNTLFEDWAYYTGSQWISWQTTSPVTIGSLNLFATDYHMARSFSYFKLYITDFQTPVLTFIPTSSFGGIYSTDINPTTGQNFKAEFGWYLTGDIWNESARIMELDGFAPVATPEPATMSLLGLGIAGLLRFRKKAKR